MPAQESGIGSSPDLVNIPNDVTNSDDDVILLDSDVEQEKAADDRPKPYSSLGKRKSNPSQIIRKRKRETNQVDDVITIDSDDETTALPVLPSTSAKKLDLEDENDSSGKFSSNMSLGVSLIVYCDI